MTLQDQFGNIDIYVFDQLLRGRIRPEMRVLDAGCGGGRNLVYLLREGYDFGVTERSRRAPTERIRSAITCAAASTCPPQTTVAPGLMMPAFS